MRYTYRIVVHWWPRLAVVLIALVALEIVRAGSLSAIDPMRLLLFIGLAFVLQSAFDRFRFLNESYQLTNQRLLIRRHFGRDRSIPFAHITRITEQRIQVSPLHPRQHLLRISSTYEKPLVVRLDRLRGAEEFVERLNLVRSVITQEEVG